MQRIDLSGAWRYETDEADVGREQKFYAHTLTGEGFHLPGSASENGVGVPFDASRYTFKEIIRAPRERYEYIGPLWLQREVDIPESFAGQEAFLSLERVNMESQLWLDGESVGRPIVELSAPHVYALPSLMPGRHVLTLRLDNRPLMTNGTWSSGYSVDTQGYWIGVAGRMELVCAPAWRLDGAEIFPDETGVTAQLIMVSTLHMPPALAEGVVTLTATAPDGRTLPPQTTPVKLFTHRQRVACRYEIADPVYWDEFNPALYQLHVRAEFGEHVCEGDYTFGLRTVRRQGRTMLLNGRPLALRGTIDCAQFPLTGYPPTDLATWQERMQTIKSYGLNHVRFHSWCPPEAAFQAADEAGIYVQVEMPLWLNRDINMPEVGDDPIHRVYYTLEAQTIAKRYGNHPCFLLFSCANETQGDFELLDDIVRGLKAVDDRRLYTLTSNFDHPVQPSEDYFSAMTAGGLPVRIQELHAQVNQATNVDFHEAVERLPVPLITFEVGQYCCYPDVSIMARYTGAMEPSNFAWIDADMRRKGVRERLPEYLAASGDLAMRLYKEDVEAALRTPGLAGFQLLALSDYTGQSTATIGLLDVFLHSKGICQPEEFRCFCDAVVPLFKAKRIFTTDEVLEAELGLYDHGSASLARPRWEVRIERDGELFYETVTEHPHISVPLDRITSSSRLHVTVTVAGHSNHWDVYVFAPGASEDVTILRTPEELAAFRKGSGNAIALRTCFPDAVQGSYIPVFWSPVHFPSAKPCGAIIDAGHPALAGFPTGRYPDYQWQALFDASYNMLLPLGARPIIETVPNFTDNVPRSPLFELPNTDAHILCCGFDLTSPHPAARQLKESITRYMK